MWLMLPFNMMETRQKRRLGQVPSHLETNLEGVQCSSTHNGICWILNDNPRKVILIYYHL